MQRSTRNTPRTSPSATKKSHKNPVGGREKQPSGEIPLGADIMGEVHNETMATKEQQQEDQQQQQEERPNSSKRLSETETNSPGPKIPRTGDITEGASPNENLASAKPVNSQQTTDENSTGGTENKAAGMTHEHNGLPNDGNASIGSKLAKLPRAVVSYFRGPKPLQPNPTAILLANTKQELRMEIKKTLDEMRGSYSSLYLWNDKFAAPWPLVRDILCREMANPGLKVFALEMDQTELLYRNQFARVLQKIRHATAQSIWAPTILFIEQIDLLFASLEGTALGIAQISFQSLRNHNVLLVATSTKRLPDQSVDIRRMFVNPPLTLRSPNEGEIWKLFQNTFKKSDAYHKKLWEFRTSVFYPDCAKCLRNLLGPQFNQLLINIFEVCKDRTPVFILRVYDILDAIPHEGFTFNHMIQNLEDGLLAWKVTMMKTAITYYDN